MPTPPEPYTLFERGWVLRIQPPTQPAQQPPRIIIALHGWTGDELSMTFLAQHLTADWVLSPRAPIQLEKGYSWVQIHGRDRATITHLDFKTTAETLLAEIDHWMKMLHLPARPLDIVGFSQGGMIAYTLASLHPERFAHVAALASYMPAQTPLEAIQARPPKFFIAHGTQDELVPVEGARQAAQQLQTTGAQVTYCESEVGHKLSALCSKGFYNFLED